MHYARLTEELCLGEKRRVENEHKSLMVENKQFGLVHTKYSLI